MYWLFFSFSFSLLLLGAIISDVIFNNSRRVCLHSSATGDMKCFNLQCLRSGFTVGDEGGKFLLIMCVYQGPHSGALFCIYCIQNKFDLLLDYRSISLIFTLDLAVHNVC